MKGIIGLIVIALLSSCGMSEPDKIAFKEVMPSARPSAFYDPATIFHDQPLDVSTTHIEYY